MREHCPKCRGSGKVYQYVKLDRVLTLCPRCHGRGWFGSAEAPMSNDTPVHSVSSETGHRKLAHKED